jgi:phosphatidate cytidylyltransferase
LAQGKASALQLRVASAAVLGPLALAAVWFGDGWLLALVLVGAAVMGWEWARLVTQGGFGTLGALTLATGLAAAALAGLGAGVGWALLAAGGGALLVLAAALRGRNAEAVWAAAGAFWLALGTIGFLALGRLPEAGRGTLFWLLGVVWASDVAAYACGRGLGGPKLAPRISPNKTWAGFFGGIAGAGVVGWIAGLLAGTGGALALLGASLLLGVAAQLGDLAESAAKRHFGVKDSSGLIPGHGGLLDRVDGLLAASVLAGALTFGAGRSPLLW